MGEKPPRTYSEIPESLLKRNVPPQSEAALARKVIGFRNVLVHAYLDVDEKLLLTIPEQRKYLDILDIALTLLKYAHEHGIDSSGPNQVRHAT
nr:DUF86 domain-containing protein [Candidatus Freyrarchaeum guaymaensis]